MKKITKRALWLTVLAFAGIVSAQAQTPNIIRITGTGECIPLSGDIQFTTDNFPTGAYWSVAGDLKIVSGKNNDTVTIASDNKNPDYNDNGYGKGRLYLYYDSPGCGTLRVSYDIYKTFDPPHDIIGPQCVVVGDSVVFSYKPILTVNINDQIGTDSYTWDLSGLSDAIPIYCSGDSSAITLRIDGLDGADTIGVYVGRCNQDLSKLEKLGLNRKAPVPTIVGETCVAALVNTTTKLKISNPTPGVYYTWAAPSDFSLSTTKGDSVIVTLLDANSTGTIIVRASYDSLSTADDCSISEANFKINRRFAPTAKITGTTCVPTNSSTYYSFSVGTGAPSNSTYNWDLPQGWDFDPSKQNDGKQIFIRPDATAKLVDTLRLSLNPCNDTVLKYVLTVKPAKLPVIHGEICVTRGSTYIYYVDTTNVRPRATDYTWTVPTGWGTPTYGVTHDTIYVTPTTNAAIGNISVRPNGLNNCNGDTTALAVKFSPIAPTGINVPSCVNSGMADTIILSVQNPIAGQQYQWSVPSGLGTINGNSTASSITIITSGVDGDYVVSVCGYSAVCGQTPSTTDTVTIAAEDYPAAQESILIPGVQSSYYIYDMSNPSWVTWHTFVWEYNGTNVSNSPPYTYSTISTLPPGLLNSPNFSVTIKNTSSGGCSTKKIFGVGKSGAPMAKSRMSNVPVPGIPVMSPSFDFTVSPNPANSTANVSFTGNLGNVKLSLYNLSGQIVETWNNITTSSVSLNISGISSGNYILVANQNANYAYKQLIIN